MYLLSVTGRSVFCGLWVGLLFFLQTSAAYAGDSLRPELQSIVNAMAEDNALKTFGIGYSGTATEQWLRFEVLLHHATDEELIQLTAHSNAVVRCYAFIALAWRQHKETFPILLRSLTDSTLVQTFVFCESSCRPVGDILLGVVSKQDFSGGTEGRARPLTRGQRQIVDSLLLYAPGIRLWKKSWLVYKLQPLPRLYRRVREIVQEGDSRAVVTLAKYRRPEDKELVIALLKNPDRKIQCYGFEAVQAYPDTAFYPYLEQIHALELQRKWNVEYIHLEMLYKTLVLYRGPQTDELFKRGWAVENKAAWEYHTKAMLAARPK